MGRRATSEYSRRILVERSVQINLCNTVVWGRGAPSLMGVWQRHLPLVTLLSTTFVLCSLLRPHLALPYRTWLRFFFFFLLMRYVSDMRRQRDVRGYGRGETQAALNVGIVDSRAGDLLVFKHADQACSSTIGPRRVDQPGVGFISPVSAAPTRPRVRLINTNGSSGVGPLEQMSPWKTRMRSRLWRPRASVLGSRQSDSFQKSFRAARPLILIHAQSQNAQGLSTQIRAHCLCQPPDRTELLSVTMCRAEAKISGPGKFDSSGPSYYRVNTKRIPCRLAAAISIVPRFQIRSRQ